MAKYFLTNKAVEDLSEIWDYSYDTWSESQADKYYEFLVDFFKGLAENPKVGKKYDEIENNILGYRAGQHIIFYRIIHSNKIEILRSLHARMDLKSRITE